MNQTLNGNGNGNGNNTNGLPKVASKKAAASASAPVPVGRENSVSFRSAEGGELHGQPARVSRHAMVVELFSPANVPRFSEVLEEFKLTLQGRLVYSGRAVVRNVMDTGTRIICEATLSEAQWTDVSVEMLEQHPGQIGEEFKAFLREWQKLYKVTPEFKVAIADMQTFLHGLQLWLEQIELGIRHLPSDQRRKREIEVALQLEPTIVPAIRSFFERFEGLSEDLEDDQVAAHQAFGKHLIHPFLLTSPFVHRTFYKPLGYAGDYEMVNMMFRDPFQGDSLFAKMINVYALQLPPIVGHRNRIGYLIQKIEKEALRVMVRGRNARIFNLGCGPAQEIQRFLAEDELANYTHFTLADFNQQTLDDTGRILGDLNQKYKRRGSVQMVKRPVQQLLKAAERGVRYERSEQYDLVYCAGLFDYLSDQVCRQLMEVFYRMLAPGGLLIATNVDDHAAQHQMECFLEWHLVHRDNEKMRAIAPRLADSQNISIKRDSTGVNVFIEVRKSEDEK